MKKEDVIKAINLAFQDVTLGNGIGLWEARAIDYHKSKAARLKIREKDEKEDWRLISYKDLIKCDGSLCFVDAEGMRFHLPAYLIASVEYGIEDPLFHLTDLNDYTKSQLTALNDVQRKAILMYLNWCLEQEDHEYEHPEIKKAIDEYWGI